MAQAQYRHRAQYRWKAQSLEGTVSPQGTDLTGYVPAEFEGTRCTPSLMKDELEKSCESKDESQDVAA